MNEIERSKSLLSGVILLAGTLVALDFSGRDYLLGEELENALVLSLLFLVPFRLALALIPSDEK